MQQCLCDRCTALCCRYFALGIDQPETPAEFDDVRWYLAHENVHVFIEDGDWYLAVQTKCQFLESNNQCGIYEDRPKICREYSTDNCDYHNTQYDFEQYFTSPEQLESYAQATLGKRYNKYVLQQRLKNTGQDKTSPNQPKTKDILHARVRPRIRAHTAKRRTDPIAASAPSNTGTSPSQPLVSLSVDLVRGSQ